jgi:hypothetical protein
MDFHWEYKTGVGDLGFRLEQENVEFSFERSFCWPSYIRLFLSGLTSTDSAE